MNLGLLLVPALSGYVLLGWTYVSRYWFARQSGYAFFFSAAVAGVVLLATARLTTVLLSPYIPSDLHAAWRDYARFDYAGTVLISALLAIALPPLVNLVTNKIKWAKRFARASGDLIECLIQEAVESKGHQLVEVSTKGSKSYIGFALESGVAAGGEPDIAIAPLVSGYRHSETRELKITTRYGPVLLSESEEQPAKDLLEHFRVVIPLAEVASARRFDPDAYELFRRQNADGAAQSDPESVESAR